MVQLSELLKVTEQIRILEYFIASPTKKVSQAEIRKKVKLAKGTVVKWLDFLVSQGLVSFEMIGLNKLYRLCNEDIIVQELKILSMLAKLRELHLPEGRVEVYVYGSYARGDYSEESDVDLLVIGMVKRDLMAASVDALSKKINKTVHFHVFSPVEWSQMARKDPAFYERVEKDKKRIL